MIKRISTYIYIVCVLLGTLSGDLYGTLLGVLLSFYSTPQSTPQYFDIWSTGKTFMWILPVKEMH